jgi:hypothetical protein
VESGRPGTIRQCACGAQRLLGATGQPRDHVIGVYTDTFELGDELSNYFRVRHPAPDWGWRRRSSVRRR